jgi:hypothetical protein
MGNGFSMAYDPEIFSYNALNRFIEDSNDELLNKLFSVINNKNFELVMRQLDNFCELVDVFGYDQNLKVDVQAAIAKLKTSLLDAVRSLHPEHVFNVPDEKSEACAKFLSRYLHSGHKIFTTNYDLLMYWVLMRNKNTLPGHVDGFGREVDNYEEFMKSEDLEYSELRWGINKEDQNVFYLHGALPLFDTGIDVVKEEYTTSAFLLENIEKRINDGEYPVFVTAGDSTEKHTHIMHNQYLTDCYENLCTINGSLITFGFNFGEYDEHIIDALNSAARQDINQKLWSVYIGVYSEADEQHINRIKPKFKKLKINMFDAKTAPVWG